MQMKKKIRRLLIVIGILLLAILIICLIFIDNKTIKYEEFKINKDGNIKIVHLSDLHFPNVEVNVEDMIKNIKELNPDAIVITGDLIDRTALVDSCGVYHFIDEIVTISRVYYVNGNHEEENIENEKLYSYLENKLDVLSNKSITVNIKNREIAFMGLENSSNFKDSYFINNNINNSYKILLNHKPQTYYSSMFASLDVVPDLVLSGHAHGGQFRFFNQGLIAPNQGLFPKYTNGLYTFDNIKLVVSRGIGSSVAPLRFNNKPHIPIIII